MERSQRYRLFLKGGFAYSFATLLLLMLLLRLQAGTAFLCVAFGLMGTGMLPLLPIALQCAVECTYPIPEESSAALLMLVGNLLGLGFTYAIQGLCDLTPDTASITASSGLLPFGWFSAALLTGSVVVVFNFHGDYLRLQADALAAAASPIAPPSSGSHHLGVADESLATSQPQLHVQREQPADQ
jgi:hypothetical protein|mmetsp:Transcript_31758/g.71739  ORF Transcript_31758/g.71739 Transcript_31758/m.71739 type:complete len:185 (-) Transcript_31758:450-1004(-)